MISARFLLIHLLSTILVKNGFSNISSPSYSIKFPYQLLHTIHVDAMTSADSVMYDEDENSMSTDEDTESSITTDEIFTESSENTKTELTTDDNINHTFETTDKTSEIFESTSETTTTHYSTIASSTDSFTELLTTESSTIIEVFTESSKNTNTELTIELTTISDKTSQSFESTSDYYDLTTHSLIITSSTDSFTEVLTTEPITDSSTEFLTEIVTIESTEGYSTIESTKSSTIESTVSSTIKSTESSTIESTISSTIESTESSTKPSSEITTTTEHAIPHLEDHPKFEEYFYHATLGDNLQILVHDSKISLTNSTIANQFSYKLVKSNTDLFTIEIDQMEVIIRPIDENIKESDLLGYDHLYFVVEALYINDKNIYGSCIVFVPLSSQSTSDTCLIVVIVVLSLFLVFALAALAFVWFKLYENNKFDISKEAIESDYYRIYNNFAMNVERGQYQSNEIEQKYVKYVEPTNLNNIRNETAEFNRTAKAKSSPSLGIPPPPPPPPPNFLPQFKMPM